MPIFFNLIRLIGLLVVGGFMVGGAFTAFMFLMDWLFSTEVVRPRWTNYVLWAWISVVCFILGVIVGSTPQ